MPKQRKQARGKQNAGKPGAKGERSAICGPETAKNIGQKSATSMRVRTPKAKVKEIKKNQCSRNNDGWKLARVAATT